MKSTIDVQCYCVAKYTPGFGFTEHTYQLNCNGTKTEEFSLRSPVGKSPKEETIKKEARRKIKGYYDLLGVDGLFESSVFAFLPTVDVTTFLDLGVQLEGEDL